MSAPETERYSITLVPPAAAAVAELVTATGLTKTDVINRSVQLAAFIERERANGKQILIRDADGTIERVHII